MIGSAADISFNLFVYHMGGIVFVAWLATLFALKFLFRAELSVTPAVPASGDKVQITDPGIERCMA